MAWDKFAGLLAGLHVIVETNHKNHLYMYSASIMNVAAQRESSSQVLEVRRHKKPMRG